MAETTEEIPNMKTQKRQTIPLPLPPPPTLSRDTTPTAADRLTEILHRHVTGPAAYVIMLINPEWAEAMLARNSGNRTLREATARKYGHVMGEGRWQPHTAEAIKFDTNGVMRDGQHRLRGVIISGASVQFTVALGCDPKEADVYDQGITRSAADISHQHGVPNANQAAALTALILRIERQDMASFDRLMITDKTDELYTGDELFDFAVKIGARCKRFGPPSSMALAYWTISHKTSRPDRLAPFWDGLITGADLPMGGPILRLRESLVGEDWGMGRDGCVKRAAATILAWNAVLERRRPRHFAWDFSVKLPEVL
jgi:hypothetical protein